MKSADLLTIGQWLESKICLFYFEGTPFTANEKYEEVGEAFVRSLLSPKTEELSEYDVHNIMKRLVGYRLTPQAIAFCYKYMDHNLEHKPRRSSKSVMHLSRNALCQFNIYARDIQEAFHIKDYFGCFEEEPFVIELDGVESLAPEAGKELIESAVRALQGIPILLRAGYLHYGDYEYDKNDEKIKSLVSFYESLGFENVNHIIGNCEDSVVMIANKEALTEQYTDMFQNSLPQPMR